MLGLTVRKRADRSEPQPVHPDTAALEPYPLAGIEIVGEPPAACKLPTGWVDKGVEEGWVSLEGMDPVHRPGGPPANPWKVTHTFRQADVVVIHCAGGDVRYAVTHQPDKYEAPSEPGGWRVDWFYGVELEA